VRSRRPQTYAALFGAGLNLDGQPYSLKDGECRASQNVVSTVRGSIKKRDGNQTFATTGASLTSLCASASPNFLLGAAGTVLYSINPAGTVTTIKTGMTNGAPWSWMNALANGGQGPIWGVNGNDIQQWDGVAATTSAWTATSGTLPSTAKYLTYAGNRAWAAGMTTFAPTADPGSTVAFSQLVNIGGGVREWPAANVVMLDPNDGESISGIARVGFFVLVFKPSKTFVIYDLNTAANRRIGGNVGCVAHRSCVETASGAFFLGKDHLYKTDGSSVLPVTRGRLSSLIQSIPAGNRQLASGAVWNDHYYLAHSTAGVANNQILDYDLQLDSFWLHTSAGAQLAVWEGDGTRRLYQGRGTSVDRMFVPGETQDNGSAFTALWASPWYTFGQPQLRKRLWAVHFDGSGRIQASLARDFSSGNVLASDVNFSGTPTLWGVGTSPWGSDTTPWGGMSTVNDARIKTPGVARAWSVVYGNSSANPFEVDSFTFEIADTMRKVAV
jgi:hypothetical protein